MAAKSESKISLVNSLLQLNKSFILKRLLAPVTQKECVFNFFVVAWFYLILGLFLYTGLRNIPTDLSILLWISWIPIMFLGIAVLSAIFGIIEILNSQYVSRVIPVFLVCYFIMTSLIGIVLIVLQNVIHTSYAMILIYLASSAFLGILLAISAKKVKPQKRLMNNISFRRENIQGFTIIEVIIVLLLISVVSVLTVTRLTSTSSYNVLSEIEILKTNLRYVQYRALSDGDVTFGSNNETWGMELSASSYTLQRNRATAPFNLPNEGTPTHNLPNGISLSVTSGSSPVAYNNWGAPVNASGNPLASNIVINLTDGNSPKAITIMQNTGFIQ